MTIKSPTLSVAVFEAGEQPARRVGDLIAESFAEEQIAVSVAEIRPGAWRVTVYFEVAPDEKALRALVEAAAGSEQAQALRFEQLAAEELGRREPGRIAAGRRRPLYRSRRARPRKDPRQPHRHRNRGRGRVRHRPSRHDARLPARARPYLQNSRARAGCACSISALAPACWRSRPPAACTRMCSRPTSTARQYAPRARICGSTASALTSKRSKPTALHRCTGAGRSI